MVTIQTILVINVIGLIFSFIGGKGKNSANLQAMIAKSSLITSTFFLWLLVMNTRLTEVGQVNQKLLPFPSQLSEATEYTLNKLGSSEHGFLMTSARSAKFPEENIFDKGFVQINFLDEAGNFLKWNSVAPNSLENDKSRLSAMSSDLSGSPFSNLKFNFEGEKPKYVMLHCSAPDVELFQSSNRTVLGITRGYLGSYFVLEQPVESGITKTDAWVKLDLSKTNSLLLVNTTTKVTELESIKSVVDLTPVLRLNSGLFGPFKRFFVYYLLFGFEKLNDFLRSPMLTIFLVILVARLVLIYPSYRSHIFSTEFNKLTAGAAGKNPEIFMQELKGQKVSFKEQAVWLMLRISVLLIMYLITRVSPSFYKSKFLWITDLSAPDNLNLSNLFGLVQPIRFVPSIGLTPFMTTGIIFFDLLRKKQPMEPRLLYLLFFVTLAVFSRMQSALCLNIAFSTALDQVQTHLFQIFITRRSKKRNKGIEKKY